MKDKGTCPYCRNDFEVTQYGWRIPCPRCRRHVNIFPDPQVFVQTSFGVCGIGIAEPRHTATTTSINTIPKWRVKNLLSSVIRLFHYWFW